MLGLSVIYQPREGSELTAEDASSDKKLVKRLEQIVVHWTKQIRIALGDQDQSNAGELLSFKDEYDFWIYRCKLTVFLFSMLYSAAPLSIIIPLSYFINFY